MMPLVTRSHNREACDKSVTVSVRVMSLHTEYRLHMIAWPDSHI